jgi:hypothetical protein
MEAGQTKRSDARSWAQIFRDMRVVARVIRANRHPCWEAWLVAWLIEARHYRLRL